MPMPDKMAALSPPNPPAHSPTPLESQLVVFLTSSSDICIGFNGVKVVELQSMKEPLFNAFQLSFGFLRPAIESLSN